VILFADGPLAFDATVPCDVAEVVLLIEGDRETRLPNLSSSMTSKPPLSSPYAGSGSNDGSLREEVDW